VCMSKYQWHKQWRFFLFFSVGAKSMSQMGVKYVFSAIFFACGGDGFAVHPCHLHTNASYTINCIAIAHCYIVHGVGLRVRPVGYFASQATETI